MSSFALFLRRKLLFSAGGFALLGVMVVVGARQATAAPRAQVASVSITCTYYSDYDRQFNVTFETRAGGAPSGTALLTNVDGTKSILIYQPNHLAVSWPVSGARN